MHFERSARRSRAIPLTPLVDVVFNLLIFFMLSTSFVRTESLELLLPSKGETAAKTSQLAQVYISEDGQLYLGRKPVVEDELYKNLKDSIARNPDLSIILLSGPGVTVQQLVSTMDTIYLSGGKNLAVANWEPKKKA
jgi:biopolymer transport protein ExbD